MTREEFEQLVRRTDYASMKAVMDEYDRLRGAIVEQAKEIAALRQANINLLRSDLRQLTPNAIQIDGDDRQ